MIRNQKGGVFLLLAVWQSLQPRGESFPLPTALEKCPQHGASGSLRSPVLNPTALQESWGSTAPLQAGSTHLKRYHSDLQNLPEDLRGGGGRAPTQAPRVLHPSLCPRDTHQPAHMLVAVVSLSQQLRIFHSNAYLQYLPALTL